MIASLLAEGRARVSETLQKGYAPTHFPHNLELIFVEDNRSSTSASMKAKIASTRERSARLRTLDSITLIWWATAFPMRQWSGGRKMSSSTFDTLLRYAPGYAAQAQPLLSAVSADLDRLQQKHSKCAMLQNFLESKEHASSGVTCRADMILELSEEPGAHWEPYASDIRALLEEGRYVNLSGVRYDFIPRLPNLLIYGMEGSRRFREERNKTAMISTALKIFVPTDPVEDDAYLLLPIGVGEVWSILHELGVETLL